MWFKKNRKDKEKNKDKNAINPNSSSMKQKIQKAYHLGQERLNKSIRLEILWTVGISFIVSSITFFCVSNVLDGTIGKYSYTSYEENKEYVAEQVIDKVNRLNRIQDNIQQYINITELYDITQEEEIVAIEDLQEYLITLTNGAINFNHSIVDHTNQTTNNEAIQKLDTTNITVRPLYEELIRLQENNKWTDETVTATLINFFEENNIDTSVVTLHIAQEIMNNLKSTIDSVSTKSAVYFVDSTGQLMYSDDYIEKIDLIKIIQSVNMNNEDSSYKAIYPISLNGEIYYIFIEATLEQQIYYGYNESIGNILGFIAAVGIFILLMIRLTKNKISYIEYLSKCLGEIAKGDLSYKIEVLGEDELAQVAKNITIMEHEIKKQIQAQIKAEKIKNELVTNVAHDLRTPLTSIIGYIGLVKDKKYTTPEEQDKYLEIAYDKSEKLKVIIEDLFELTKLHQDGVQLKKEVISISHLLNQLIEELMPLASEKNIEVQTYIEPTTAEVLVDVAKITRVFENLIENAIKYSEEGNAIYIELKEFSKQVYVAVSNHSDNIPQEEVDKFFERFYRADKSRNSQAGGSGLGLAIAKNIVELHGGKISAKVNNGLISFKVGLLKYKG